MSSIGSAKTSTDLWETLFLHPSLTENCEAAGATSEVPSLSLFYRKIDSEGISNELRNKYLLVNLCSCTTMKPRIKRTMTQTIANTKQKANRYPLYFSLQSLRDISNQIMSSLNHLVYFLSWSRLIQWQSVTQILWQCINITYFTHESIVLCLGCHR